MTYHFLVVHPSVQISGEYFSLLRWSAFRLNPLQLCYSPMLFFSCEAAG